MKIGIITMHGVRNYGSVLQSLATQVFFQQMGWEAELIDYRRDDYRTIRGALKEIRRHNSLPAFLVKAIIILPTFFKQNQVFEGFCKKHLHLSPQSYNSERELEQHPPQADVYCTGSDQVWNSKLNKGILPQFFLAFAPKGKNRISFAASFGKKSLDEWEKEEIRHFLQQYDYITVRESSGVHICQELGINNACCILDPTLLQPRKFWMQMIKERPINQKYILVYRLHKEPGLDKYLKELSNRTGFKVLRICYGYHEIMRYGHPLIIPKVEDWLSAIYHAELIVTDSFHATAFSTNLRKRFISIISEQQFGGRITSLLEMTGLQKQAIHSFNDFTPLENKIEWGKIEEIYKDERIKTQKLFNKLLAH